MPRIDSLLLLIVEWGCRQLNGCGGEVWDAVRTHMWGIWGGQTSWKKLNVS